MMVLLQLFWVFFKISLLSFGGIFGVLPEMERMVVGQYHWVSHAEFIQAYVLGQFLPGPNMAMCSILGYQVAGIPGAAISFLGIYSAPLGIMGLAHAYYDRLRENSTVRRVEAALRPVILGLLGASALRLWYFQTTKSDHDLLWRVLSLMLMAAGFWLYTRKILGAFPAMLAVGVFWFLVNYAIYV